MRLTYTIQVCNESRELFSLLNFLSKTIDEEDEINVVADSINVTDKVEHVLDHFKERINVFKRPFDQFHTNAQFHIEKATGDYIFGVDADEMPQEILIKNIKKIIKDSGAEIIAVPRINIHPGATHEFIEKSKFNVNDVGFINWPDFQTRVYKRCDHIKWTDELHTKLTGSDKVVGIQADPKLALWHVKSIEKQESRWDDSGGFKTPTGSLYDLLM
jgi:hypothetical protein